MKQQGVAGYDSWGDRPLPEHTLPANKEYHWGFTLMPLCTQKIEHMEQQGEIILYQPDESVRMEVRIEDET
eukprot:4275291-Prorocentrum_lima.AAC.1